MTADQWLQENAVDCVRMGARITPQACAMYRAAEPVACKGCEGFGVVLDAGEAERVSASRPSRLFVKKTKRTKVEDRPMRKCEVEGCTGKHAARGLCKRHYAQQFPSPIKQVSQLPVSGRRIYLDVSEDDKALIDALVASAKQSRRELSAEILFRLESTI